MFCFCVMGGNENPQIYSMLLCKRPYTFCLICGVNTVCPRLCDLLATSLPLVCMDDFHVCYCLLRRMCSFCVVWVNNLKQSKYFFLNYGSVRIPYEVLAVFNFSLLFKCGYFFHWILCSMSTICHKPTFHCHQLLDSSEHYKVIFCIICMCLSCVCLCARVCVILRKLNM